MMQHNVCEQLFSAAAGWAANQWLQRERSLHTFGLPATLKLLHLHKHGFYFVKVYTSRKVHALAGDDAKSPEI